MAIVNGLIGNPVITGLLGRGGPVGIQQAANAQIARMQQRPQAARLRAPGAINLPPDNSLGQGLSQLGKALGDIADMKEQSAAKKDLADLYGQTTTVQEPGTGQTASVPRQVTSGDIYKLMGKYINNPTIQKSLGLQAQRLALQEREQREANLRRDLQRGQIQSREKISSDQIESREKISGDQIASREGIATGQNVSREKIAGMKAEGTRGTLNQIRFPDGTVKAILRQNNQDYIINDDGQRVAVETVLANNKGAYIAKPEDYQPTSAEKKSEGKVTAEVERGRNEFAEIETILTKIENNPELVGFRGDVVASAVTMSQILGNVFGDNGITRMGKMLAGDKKSQAFIDNINNMSEKLFESYIQLRTKAKGSRPIAEELKELKKLTNLREWTSSEKILANVENLRRRLKEDLEVIEKKKNIITGEGASTKSNSSGSGTTTNGLNFQWREVTD